MLDVTYDVQIKLALSRMWKLRWPVTLMLVVAPLSAHANFFWPPMLYLLSFTLWWVVAGGLVIESVVHRFLLPVSAPRAIGIAIGTNLVSALLGTLLLLPVLIYTPIVEAIPEVALLPSVIVIVIAIPLVNIALEYFAATRLWKLARTRRTVTAFAVANILSFGLVLYGVSFIKVL